MLPNGCTFSTSLYVMSPAWIESRTPPEFITAKSALARCMCAIAIMRPKLVCSKRTTLRSPSSLPLLWAILMLSCSWPFSWNGRRNSSIALSSLISEVANTR
ncbi:Uncharacterised protein [Vibrio cholerae]|nr:Uncharacterised protein [Vibrio cholerae]CSB92535.1 Uncharacterised protein [Vibrio cholerae]CSC77477.1 Uncharacterised protein [Vibrio cholerae]CSC87055.1 Uncharacterised protein [Vibrio cholerae]